MVLKNLVWVWLPKRTLAPSTHAMAGKQQGKGLIDVMCGSRDI